MEVYPRDLCNLSNIALTDNSDVCRRHNLETQLKGTKKSYKNERRGEKEEKEEKRRRMKKRGRSAEEGRPLWSSLSISRLEGFVHTRSLLPPKLK